MFQGAPVVMCGQSDVAEAYASIEGSLAVRSSTKLEMPDTDASALFVKQEGKHLICYIGTSAAEISKVSLPVINERKVLMNALIACLLACQGHLMVPALPH